MSRLFLLLALVTAVLIGCAGSDETAPAPNYVFNVDLTSNFTDIRTFNDGTRQAGWLRFDGDTTVNGQAITLSVQSAVNYTRGSGPLSGLLTLTFPDTSTVTIRMAGNSSFDDVTKVSSFKADLEVLGGTGSFLNAQGAGILTGRRDTAVGGPVKLDVRVAIH